MTIAKTFFLAALMVTACLATEKKATKPAKAKKAESADLVKGKKVFEMYCVSCHGAKGVGDGVAAAALNPKPRNFTDSAYMAAKTDEQLKKVIVEGGAANGLSPMMAPWGGTLKPDEITNVLGYVRQFAKK